MPKYLPPVHGCKRCCLFLLSKHTVSRGQFRMQIAIWLSPSLIPSEWHTGPGSQCRASGSRQELSHLPNSSRLQVWGPGLTQGKLLLFDRTLVILFLLRPLGVCLCVRHGSVVPCSWVAVSRWCPASSVCFQHSRTTQGFSYLLQFLKDAYTYF